MRPHRGRAVWIGLVVLATLAACKSDAARAREDNERKAVVAKGAADLIHMQAQVYRATHPRRCPTAAELGSKTFDPWGRPFLITCRPNLNVADVTVVSIGADGIEGSEDDIRVLPAGGEGQ